MTRISIELPDELALAVQQMARERGVAESTLVAEALVMFADTEAGREQRVEEGRADIAAGRYVEHEAVAAWLRSWGTDRELPPPQCS